MSNDTDRPQFGDRELETSWPSYRRAVLERLKKLDEQNERQNESIAKLDKDFAVLSTRVMLTASALALVVSAVVDGIVRLFAH